MDSPSVEPTPVTDKAGPWIRLGARLIDALILLIPTLIITVPIGGGFFIGSGNRSGASFIAGLLGTLLQFAYFVFMESTRGATVGKQACGLQVGAAQEALSMETAAKRNAWVLLGIVPFVGGLIELVVVIVIAVTISSDALGQGVHDKWAGLRVSRR
jgi:uncharacterized RDD family membrane protein YckC